MLILDDYIDENTLTVFKISDPEKGGKGLKKKLIITYSFFLCLMLV